MARVRSTAFPLGNYPAGVRVLPESDILDDVTAFVFEVARCTTAAPTVWPSASVLLRLEMEISHDGGASWSYLGGGAAPGGVWVDRGIERPTTRWLMRPAPGLGRKVRGTLEIIGGTLRSSAVFEVGNDPV